MTDNPGETAPTSVSRAATKMVEVTSLAAGCPGLRPAQRRSPGPCVTKCPRAVTCSFATQVAL
jgi:hypothetical protein